MKRILMVDDLRTNTVAEEAEDIFTYVRTLKAALSIFEYIFVDGGQGYQYCNYNEIWLDHDLGQDDQGKETDVRPFVLLLEEIGLQIVQLSGVNILPKIKLITANPVGGAWMKQALEKYYEVSVEPMVHPHGPWLGNVH